MSEMTISQALRHVARLKGKLAEYKVRAAASVSYKKDEKPAYQFSSMMEKIASAREELIVLESRIALTNATTRLDFGGSKLTLTQAIKTLQEHKDELAWLKTLVVRSGQDTKESELRYTGAGHQTVDVHFACDFPEAKRSERSDEVQAKFDALNDHVERKNHETPLVAA